MRRRKRRLRHLVLFMVPICIGACDNTTGSSENDFYVGIHSSATLIPFTVSPGDTFRFGVRIDNYRNDTLKLQSQSNCVVVPRVTRDGIDQLFNGTGFSCLAISTVFTIPPNDSLVRWFDIVALQIDTDPTNGYIKEPEPGEYVIQGIMHLDSLTNPELDLIVVEEQ